MYHNYIIHTKHEEARSRSSNPPIITFSSSTDNLFHPLKCVHRFHDESFPLSLRADWDNGCSLIKGTGVERWPTAESIAGQRYHGPHYRVLRPCKLQLAGFRADRGPAKTGWLAFFALVSGPRRS